MTNSFQISKVLGILSLSFQKNYKDDIHKCSVQGITRFLRNCPTISTSTNVLDDIEELTGHLAEKMTC